MNNRFLLYVAFSLVLFMVWQQWKIEQNPLPTASKISETQNNPETFVDMPDEAIRDESSETTKNTKERLYLDENKKKGENILLSNNAIEITIDTVGGTIKRSKLLNYFESTDENSLNIYFHI